MKTILFQGDSITDSGRWTPQTIDIGHGYAAMVAATLGYESPEAYKFINRGISGNHIAAVYARIRTDIINIKPDLMSFMIGVNDVWHDLSDDPGGIATPKFRRIYDLMMTEIKEELPNCQILLMTPYYTEKSATFSADFKEQVMEKQEVTREMAKKYGTALYDTQEVVNEWTKRAPLEYWTPDGVHPTMFGHKSLAEGWLKVFRTMDLG